MQVRKTPVESSLKSSGNLLLHISEGPKVRGAPAAVPSVTTARTMFSPLSRVAFPPVHKLQSELCVSCSRPTQQKLGEISSLNRGIVSLSLPGIGPTIWLSDYCWRNKFLQENPMKLLALEVVLGSDFPKLSALLVFGTR